MPVRPWANRCLEAAWVVGAVIATLPVWGRGFPLGHDALWEAIRIREFAAVLGDGEWLPRWAPNLSAGYGYPIFNFFPPLCLYLAGGLVSVGLSVTSAAKCLIIVLALVGGAGVYFSVRPWGGGRAATAAAALYSLAPYRFYAAFGRDAFSELAAASVLPWLLVGIGRMSERPARGRDVLFVAAAGAAAASAHNLSVVMYAPLVALFVALSVRKRLGPVLFGLGLGGALAASYVLPALFELPNVQMDWSSARAPKTTDALLGLASFPHPPWSTTLVFLGATLGIAVLGLAARPSDAKARRLLIGLVIWSLLCACLPLAPSRPLWQNIRSLDPFGFPWRWFGPASVAASLGAGLALGKLERPGLRRWAWPLLACGLGAGVYEVGGWRAPRASLDQPSLWPASYSGVWVTTTMLDEYLPVSVRLRPPRPARQTFVCAYPARCSEGPRTAYHRSAIVETGERARVLVQSFAFPGWVVSVDGRPAVVEVLPTGSMAIAVEPGRQELALDFQGTPLEHAALGVSGLALVIALLVLLADVRAGPS